VYKSIHIISVTCCWEGDEDTLSGRSFCRHAVADVFYGIGGTRF